MARLPSWGRVGTRDIGSLSGKGGDVCEEQKRMINLCCLWVRWRGQDNKMLGVDGRRYKLW